MKTKFLRARFLSMALVGLLAAMVALALPSAVFALPDEASGDDAKAEDEAGSGETDDDAPKEAVVPRKKRGMHSTGTTPPPPPPPASDGKKGLGMRMTADDEPEVPPLPLGEFLIRVAGAMQLPPPEGGFSPDSAAFALRGKGIEVRSEMTSRVTEADIVAVLNGLGYRVRTTTPSRVLDGPRTELLISTFIPSNS